MSTLEFECGYDVNGLAFIGYRHCGLPSNEWQAQGSVIVGDPFGRLGASVALSRTGRTLLCAEPGAQRVLLFDKDGSKWFPRAASLDVDISIQSITASSGPGDLLSSPTFLPPIFLAISGIENEVNSTVLFYYCTIQSCEEITEVPSANSVDISADGSTIAFSFQSPPTIYVAQVEHPRDTKASLWIPRENIFILHATNYTSRFREENSTFVDIDVKAIGLSANGDRLAVEIEERFWTGLPGQRYQFYTTIIAFAWSGNTYLESLSTVLSRGWSFDPRSNIETLLRPSFAISGDGNLIVATVSNCAQQAFVWNGTAWAVQGERIQTFSECDDSNIFGAGQSVVGQSITISEDGTAVAVGMDHKGAGVSVLRWNDTGWERTGDLIPSGPRVSIISLARRSFSYIG